MPSSIAAKFSSAARSDAVLCRTRSWLLIHFFRRGALRSAVIVAATLASLATTTLAQSVAPVTPDDEVYATITLLAAFGFLDGVVIGPRSMSQSEAIRLLDQASADLGRGSISERPWAKSAIERALRRLRREGVRPLDSFTLSGAMLDGPPRQVDPTSQIHALIHPLGRVGDGQDLADGGTTTLQSQHSMSFGTRASIVLAPRLIHESLRGGATTTSLIVDRGVVAFALGNARIDIGRDFTAFGQAPTGGLLLSTYAPTLTQLRIGTDHPTRLLGPLSRLGLLHASGFIADLGQAQNFPHAKLIAYDVSLLPHPRLELGVQVLDEMGGNGAPGAKFFERVLDAIPLGDAVYKPHSDFLFSNKMMGVDVRWRAVHRIGLEFYGEALADDFDKRQILVSLHDDMGYLLGATLSCFLSCGTGTLRAEFHRTGLLFYQHNQFVSGVTEHGELLGDPLGPKGTGWYLSATRTTARHGRFAITSGYETYDGTLYTVHLDPPDDRNRRFVPVVVRPDERRFRSIATWSIDLERPLSIAFSSGIERTTNINFVSGPIRVGGIGAATLTYRP